MEAPDYRKYPDYKWFTGCDAYACHGIELSYIFGSFRNIEEYDQTIQPLEVPQKHKALRNGLKQSLKQRQIKKSVLSIR